MSTLGLQFLFACASLYLANKLLAPYSAKLVRAYSAEEQVVKQRMLKTAEERQAFDPHDTDPGLLKKHSSFRAYTVNNYHYPSIRTFYRAHPQRDQLPSKPAPIPLLVFVHGLGGSLNQFKPILTSLIGVASCLGIDLPGCGRSAFEPRTWSAYTPETLAELLCTAILTHIEPDQEVILVGHSLGSLLCAMLAGPSTPCTNAQRRLSECVIGVIGICPVGEIPSGRQARIGRLILCLPSPAFDLLRAIDRIGGPNSKSVRRFVGDGAGLEVRALQQRFNRQSRTAVYRRMAWNLLQEGMRKHTDWPLEAWARVRAAVYLIGGDADPITRVDQIRKISHSVQNEVPETPTADPNDSTIPLPTTSPSATSTSTSATLTAQVASLGRPKSGASILKTTIFPAPASHALLYDPATCRTLSGLLQAFFSQHIDPRLCLGWQLQYLSTEGKWDVKNLAKWESVLAVSAPIANIFRAMKTLREVDPSHCPAVFASQWESQIGAVIDISHEAPVYDPRGLEERGIEYYKIPTVSKIPPTRDEVAEFIRLVDLLRRDGDGEQNGKLVGVHCHYGFNRTGFFICSYLVEALGWTVQDAIEEFAKRREPGIRHAHFLDELSVRYHVGLRKQATL